MNNRRISRGVLRQGFLAVAVLWTLCLLSGVAAAGNGNIDPANGNFSGHAWSENVGWIKFDGTAGDNTAYNVKTEPNVYMVTPSAGVGGSIAPPDFQEVKHNDTIDFTVTPDPDYRISFVTGCSGILSDNTYTTGPVTDKCSVKANFILNTYTLDNQIVDSGSTLANNADHDGVTVNEGGTVNNNASLSNLTNHGTINGGTVSGSSSNSGVLNQVDIASGSILDNNGGTISGGENNGTVFGGSIKGFYENNGVLSGMAPDGTPDADYTLVIEPGAVATGGTLEGDIVNMGSLVDVTFGEDASILFLPWTNGEPGRLEGTISFIDASGLVFVIEIPSEAIFPDPDTIGEDGLMLNARNFLDYAWDHEWDIEVNMAAAPLNEEAIIAIPNGYFLVGGTVLSEEGSKSSAPVGGFCAF